MGFFGEGRGRHKIMHKKFSFETIAFDTSFKGLVHQFLKCNRLLNCGHAQSSM